MPTSFELPPAVIEMPYRPDGWKHPDVQRVRSVRNRQGLALHSERYDGDKVFAVAFDDLGKFRLLSKEQSDAERRALSEQRTWIISGQTQAVGFHRS